MKQARFRRILAPSLVFRAKPVAKNLFASSPKRKVRISRRSIMWRREMEGDLPLGCVTSECLIGHVGMAWKGLKGFRTASQILNYKTCKEHHFRVKSRSLFATRNSNQKCNATNHTEFNIWRKKIVVKVLVPFFIDILSMTQTTKNAMQPITLNLTSEEKKL